MWNIIGFADSREFKPPHCPAEDEIGSAESALRILFPPSFRSFLQSDATVTIPKAASFFWVGTAENNIVDLNNGFHRSSSGLDPFTGRERSIPPVLAGHLEAFFTDGNGNLVCFDRNTTINQSPAICLMDHELLGEPAKQIADSFEDWFAMF